jgi:8-oxo-dGTP diphosphatase
MTNISIAIVCWDDTYLVGVRQAGQELAGYAEFPGGKVREGEAAEAAAVRECEEETGLRVEVIEELGWVEHEYEFGGVRLAFFLCRPCVGGGPPREPFAWVPRSELTVAMFPPANAQVMRRLGFAEC